MPAVHHDEEADEKRQQDQNIVTVKKVGIHKETLTHPVDRDARSRPEIGQQVISAVDVKGFSWRPPVGGGTAEGARPQRFPSSRLDGARRRGGVFVAAFLLDEFC
jgi:hypothetical protein